MQSPQPRRVTLVCPPAVSARRYQAIGFLFLQLLDKLQFTASSPPILTEVGVLAIRLVGSPFDTLWIVAYYSSPKAFRRLSRPSFRLSSAKASIHRAAINLTLFLVLRPKYLQRFGLFSVTI